MRVFHLNENGLFCTHPLSVAPLFWWKERGKQEALIWMKNSHLNRILQYIQATCVVNISDEYFFRLECRLYYNINIETMPWRVKGIINCKLENESSGIMSFLFHHPKAYYKFPMPSVLIHTIASCWEHPVVIFCFLEFFIGQCLLISIPT